MTILGTFILLYIFTIVLIAVLVYIDMEKGETLEEYANESDFDELSIFLVIPVLNSFMAICFTLHVIYNKLKYFRK